MLKSWAGRTRNAKVSGVGLYGSGRKSQRGSSGGREKCSTDKLNGKGHKRAHIVCVARNAASMRSDPLGAQRSGSRVLHAIDNKPDVLVVQRKEKGGSSPLYFSVSRGAARKTPKK